jgi:branched-subunit amino acid aminotransferase/4-amino-4-deoxychorismate lyase
VEREQARVSVFDNSLLYAEGLFETILSIDDRLIFEKEHLTRLFKGAAVIGLRIPVSRERLSRWMHKTVEAHPDRIKKLRLTVTSGEAARWVGHQGKPQIILSASPHRLPHRPFRLYVSGFRIDQQSIFRRIKTLSYAIHAAALKQAREKGYDDALLVNQRGKIAEVTSANVYWVKKGRIFTPPVSSGCLEGVTRKSVLRQARKLGYTIRERDQTVEGLLEADEVFMSSSLKLLIGVSPLRYGRRDYHLPQGPITAVFREHFLKLAGAHDIKEPIRPESRR